MSETQDRPDGDRARSGTVGGGAGAHAAGGGLHLRRGAGLGAAHTCSPAAGRAWVGWPTCSRPPDADGAAHAAGRRSSATSRRCWCGTARACGCSPTPAGTAATSCSPRATTSQRRSIICPYHAWTYDLGRVADRRRGLPRRPDASRRSEHGLVELPVTVWEGWVFGHALHPLGSDRVPSFAEHLGDLAPLVTPYDCGGAGARRPAQLRGRGELEGDRGELPRVLPLPADPPELCQVSPPDSGDNYDLPGAWVGGSMDLRDGHGDDVADRRAGRHAAARRRPDARGVPAPAAQPAGVGPPRLRDDAPAGAAGPGRTWIECSWLVAPGADGSVPDAAGAVEFWDLTNRQDWAACESVQRGLASPHFRPGPFAPNEDAVARPGGHDRPGLPRTVSLTSSRA